MSGLKFIKYNRPKNHNKFPDFGREVRILDLVLTVKDYQLQPMLLPQLRHL